MLTSITAPTHLRASVEERNHCRFLQVSELRERRYEACGLGSSYLFRVDDEMVVDATKRVCALHPTSPTEKLRVYRDLTLNLKAFVCIPPRQPLTGVHGRPPAPRCALSP